MNKTYYILLDQIKIGTTELEKADAPMGAVFGKVLFDSIVSGYDFFKAYCLTNHIEIITDYPDDRLITTSNIPELRVINLNGIEIKGQGINIEGMDSDNFDITILGIPNSFYQEEFPHHVKAYNEMFK
jgi:hypothetical protein